MDTKRFVSIFIVLLLATQAQFTNAQSFEQWFEDGVMRVDVVFSGTADETTYALSGVKKETYYSGSRTNLIDPFDFGDHKFEVKDALSGELIFSYTFCTLFREWQTTDEANELRKSFPHVLRFPWPKNEVVVEISDRQRGGEFVKHWSANLDPGSVFIDPSQPMQFEVVDLDINGSAAEKVDILFLAEGYTETEMDKFIEDAERSASYIFSEEPFKSLKDQFNVRAVKSISMESGTDIPGHQIWKNTVLNSNFYTFGIERYMTTPDFNAVCDVASNAHYDQVYILVNTNKYGGGGIYNFYSISAADNVASRAVVIHEFGHAFGALADEYYNSSVAYNDFFPLDVEPWNANLTTLVDFDSKWKDMLPEGTPIPTEPTEDQRNKLGVYEGGGYVTKGVYRPMIDCRMHSNDATFCPVCSRALKNMVIRVCAQ